MEKKLIGYVVNVWDSLNYQIDLPNLDENIKYNVHQDTYTYQENGMIYDANVYRCRIRNIKRITSQNKNKIKELETEMENRINKLNGWVLVKPFHIDIYNRLIVDIYDPITLENFYDILLKHGSVIEKY